MIVTTNGSAVEVQYTATVNGVPTDPTTITVAFRLSGGAWTTPAAMVRDALGSYHYGAANRQSDKEREPQLRRNGRQSRRQRGECQRRLDCHRGADQLPAIDRLLRAGAGWRHDGGIGRRRPHRHRDHRERRQHLVG